MDVEVLSHNVPQDWAMEALLTGPLTVHARHAGIGEGDDAVVVRWPYGTWWDGATDELVSAEGRRYGIGTEMHLGGGFVDEPSESGESRWTAEVFDMGANTVGSSRDQA